MLNERDPDGLFDLLEPPAGGLAGLRERIGRHRRRRVRAWRLTAATAGAAVILLAVLLSPAFDRGRAPVLDPGSDLLAVRLGLAEPPAETVTVPPAYRRDFAVRRVPTTDDRVAFYLVGSR